MKNRLSLQQRLIFPIVLLGLVAVLSNVLAVFSINNVNSMREPLRMIIWPARRSWRKSGVP